MIELQTVQGEERLVKSASHSPGPAARAVASLACALFVVAATWLASPADVRAATDERVPPAAAPRVDVEGIYAMTMTRSDTGIHVVEYWSKGAILRAHTTINGHPFVTIVSKDTYYTLDPVFRRGVAIARNDRAMAADKGRLRLFGNELEDMLAEGAEKVRSERSPAGPLDVYRVTNDYGRRTVWVTADEYKLPLKFDTFDRSTGVESSLDYLSWSPLRLRDEFFEPPGEGWQIDRIATYNEWMKASPTETFKQAPIIFPLLLHGRPR